MGRFDDTLSSLGRGEDGTSVAYPDTFLDDIGAAYAEDMSVPIAKISVLETDMAGALAKIDELKAHNYDLLMQVPATPEEPVEQDPETPDEPEDEDDLDKVFG